MPSSDVVCIGLHGFLIDPVPTNRKFLCIPFFFISHLFSELKIKVSLTVLDSLGVSRYVSTNFHDCLFNFFFHIAKDL